MIRENDLKVDDLPLIAVKLISFERDELATMANPSLYDDLTGYIGWDYVTVVNVNPREREAVIRTFLSDYSDAGIITRCVVTKLLFKSGRKPLLKGFPRWKKN